MSLSLDQQQLRQQQQNQDQQEFLHTEPSSYYNDRSFGSERTAYSAYPPSFTSQTTKQDSLSANYKPGGGPDDSYAESRDSYSADGHHHNSTTNLRPNRGDGDVLEPPQPAYMSPRHDGRDSVSDDGTASGTDDEFDWDREEDAGENEDENAGIAPKGRTRAKRGRALYLWLAGLSRWFRTTLIAIVGCGILIIPFAVVHTHFYNNPARIEVQAWSLFLTISFAAGCLTTVAVDFLPQLFVILVLKLAGRVPGNLNSHVELIMSVSLYTKIMFSVAWSWIILSVVLAAVKPPLDYWVIINRIVSALFAASAILWAEKVLLRAISIGFHKKSLADRLIENQSALRALDKLSNAVPTVLSRPRHFRKGSTPYASRPSSPGPRAVDFAAQSLSRPIASAPQHMSSFGGIEPAELEQERQKEGGRRWRKRSAKKTVTGIGRQIREFAMEGIFGKGPEIGSLASARQLARKLFQNLDTDRTVDGQHVLTVEEFYPYFKTEEDAKEAFRHFDTDGNGDITKKEMRSCVQRIYRERKALTASLADMSSAIGKLDGVLIGVALIIIIFICLLIFNRSGTVSSLVPLSTIVLGFSFIFANSAKTLFESLIFIFATHPFDVGDLVLIDTDWLFVKEFGLVSTVFRRVDGQELIAPNALLASSKLIHNIRRSRAMWEVCSIQIGYDTPLEVIEDLKTRVKNYLNENSREWGGGMQLDIDSITKQNAIAINIAIEHKNNWQDWGARWGRRTAFLKNLKTQLHELEITYSLPIQPIIVPSNIDDQTFAQNIQLGNAGGSGGTLQGSPFLAAPGGGRPSLSVNTGMPR